MKTSLFLLALLLISVVSPAQTTDSTSRGQNRSSNSQTTPPGSLPPYMNTLQKRLDSSRVALVAISKQLNDFQYTRIPNKDFEEIIDSKILEKVVRIVGAISAIFGALFIAFVIFYAKSKENDLIKNLNTNLNKEIEVLQSKLTTTYENKIATFRKEFEDYKQRVDESDNRERKFTTEVHFDTLVSRLQGLNVALQTQQSDLKDNYNLAKLNDVVKQGDKVVNRMKDLLEETSSSVQYNDITKELIDRLSEYLYSARKDEELVQLLDKYEKKVPSLVSGYAYTSLVLVQFNRYFNETNSQSFDKFLSSLSLLEEKNPGYGAASALRLQVFTKEYNNTQGEEQSKIKNHIQTILSQLASSYVGLMAYETVVRLNLDSTTEPFDLNIVDLYNLFTEKMNKVEEKARMYLLKSYKATGKGSYLDELNRLFPPANVTDLVPADQAMKEANNEILPSEEAALPA